MQFTQNDFAIRVRTLITMRGELPGASVRPVRKLDNAFVVARKGRIASIGRAGRFRIDPGLPLHDLGDALLFPPLVNAHTHLQLSWLEGRTLWGRGFAPWLGSMVPQLLQMTSFEDEGALARACGQLAQSGCRLVGDVGASIPGALAQTSRAALASGLRSRHFCEWFGWEKMEDSPWSRRCREEASAMEGCAPAGHALYSTSPQTLRAARQWCLARNLPFSFHLAESPEETEMLASGSGPLYEFYAGKVLPPDWRPPGLSPLRHAQALGLLGPGTLAVHGVRLEAGEIASFAQSGAALCLCPRSNQNLGVGAAPARELLQAGALLCLGTDGLTSCQDLDVGRDAAWLREKLDIPLPAIWRMLTVNGAAALGFASREAWLLPGSPAVFSILPPALAA